MPFAVKLGVELELATAERVVGRLAWAPDLCTSGGVLHGGALMTLADTLGGICASLNLPKGAGTATISSATNMLRAVRDGHIVGAAVPLHVGRTTIVIQTDVRDPNNLLVAQVTQTQAVLSDAGSSEPPSG